MFKPDMIYYEKNITSYRLGKELLEKYKDVPQVIIESHNKIDELRSMPNTEFAHLKKHLIIGVRKTHKYEPNHKVSDFLVPYTSSGCTAMCMYCYLVCNFNKCSYLRLFVNREEMLEKIIKTANKLPPTTTFEIGSNSDLVLENTITGNLPWTIENFIRTPNGILTFPTKFDMVDPILNINAKNRIIPRMSVNPQEIINMVEFGTSRLNDRITAINKLKDSGYNVGILVAPIILINNWEKLYENLFKTLSEKLTEKAKKEVFFEMIFMTYSYVHRMINSDMFPNAVNLFDKDQMTMRGRGKYMYKQSIKESATKEILTMFRKYFPKNKLIYIV